MSLFPYNWITKTSAKLRCQQLMALKFIKGPMVCLGWTDQCMCRAIPCAYFRVVITMLCIVFSASMLTVDQPCNYYCIAGSKVQGLLILVPITSTWIVISELWYCHHSIKLLMKKQVRNTRLMRVLCHRWVRSSIESSIHFIVSLVICLHCRTMQHRWPSARLQYLHCLRTRDTAVLH